jgi:titin
MIFRFTTNKNRSKANERARAFRPGLEQLETRLVPSTMFTVTTSADSGLGSLRQAILDANASQAPSVIDFQIGSGAQTINLASALPTVTTQVVIDGTSQPGYAGAPLVELNGAGAGAGANGLVLAGGNSQVEGLVINRFAGDGIDLETLGGDIVNGNYLGTNFTGTQARGNGAWGVHILGTSNNVIGGTTLGSRNLISGNTASGIRMDSGASNNLVEGNYIGTDVTGTKPLGNGLRGIMVLDSANNVIGGTSAGAGNLISGNVWSGIRIDTSTGTLVEGNFLGTDVSGTKALGNGLNGVHIYAGSDNIIGGTSGQARNIISGNAASGVKIESSTGNIVEGNFIGTNVIGTQKVSNGIRGVMVLESANTVLGGTQAGAGNVISGNVDSGIRIDTSTGTMVEGNLIGIDASGSRALENGLLGVHIVSGSGNVIGGTTSAARNVISGNDASGVRIDTGAMGNVVEGNFIGTDISGTQAVGNHFRGIVIVEANGNTIGGTTPGAGNVISGNAQTGVLIDTSTGILIEGNLIGTDVSGTQALGNLLGVDLFQSANNTVGGLTADARNVISGNLASGIRIDGGSSANLVQGNYIGTDVTGTHALANALRGINISSAFSNTIGGSAAGAGNLISANELSGIRIEDGSSGNSVQGNWIGTQADGTSRLGNDASGVVVDASANNTIGGTTAGTSNIIAFNGIDGVSVQGVNATGNAILGNSIFGNGLLGIDLGGEGVITNSSLGSLGPNHFQAFPVLTLATSANGTTTISGTLDSTPNSTFRVEFFANNSVSKSGYGQGHYFLGSVNVTTDGTGHASFTATLSASASGVISATATDSGDNTSEFALDIPVTPLG